MPYIKSDRRTEFPENVGELTYQLTRVCSQYIKLYGKKFSSLSTCVAALECAKLEFYRRLLAPYEDTKIKENGDAF